jgi:hypothetical protein
MGGERLLKRRQLELYYMVFPQYFSIHTDGR